MNRLDQYELMSDIPRNPLNPRKAARQRQRRAEARAAKAKGEAGADGASLPRTAGVAPAPDETRMALVGKRFVFTSAQNNTDLHEGFWKALNNFCEHNDAKLYVSRFTYNKAEWQKRGGISKDAKDEEDGIYYDKRILKYQLDEQVKVTDGLVFCGELVLFRMPKCIWNRIRL